MTHKEIQHLFLKVVQDTQVMSEIGASKYQVYNWRNPDRQETKVGTMLEVLWKTGHLQLQNYVGTLNGELHPIKASPREVHDNN